MGPYDNEAGVHLASDDWEKGQWLVAEDGMLYIIPVAGDDVEGPDDGKAAEILALLGPGRGDALSEGQAQDLGLTIVSDVLKRFDPTTGYYTA